jgi:hypothetical protein
MKTRALKNGEVLGCFLATPTSIFTEVICLITGCCCSFDKRVTAGVPAICFVPYFFVVIEMTNFYKIESEYNVFEDQFVLIAPLYSTY